MTAIMPRAKDLASTVSIASSGKTSLSFLRRQEWADWSEYVRILLVATAAIFCSQRYRQPNAPLDLLGLAATLFSGYPIFSRALKNIGQRQLTVELALTLTIAASVWVGASSLGLWVMLSFLLVKVIEGKTIAQAQRSLHAIAHPGFPLIINAVQQALQVPAPVQITADWILRFLVGLSFGAALFALVTTREVKAAISVLIIGTTYGLGSYVFLPILGAMSRAARRGILIKATGSLEHLARVDVAVLDRSAVVGFGGIGTVQSSSRDVSNENLRCALYRLSRMKIKTVLFTSDLEPIGRLIADSLGVNVLEAELFPEDKVCKVAAMRQCAKAVVMLSDGVNDRAALAEADVGVIVGSATFAAEHFGDMIVSGQSLSDFVEILAIARRTRTITRTNLILDVLIASIGMGLAMGGRLDPTVAVAIRLLSELALFLNAARLLPLTRQGQKIQHGIGETVDSDTP